MNKSSTLPMLMAGVVLVSMMYVYSMSSCFVSHPPQSFPENNQDAPALGGSSFELAQAKVDRDMALLEVQRLSSQMAKEQAAAEEKAAEKAAAEAKAEAKVDRDMALLEVQRLSFEVQRLSSQMTALGLEAQAHGRVPDPPPQGQGAASSGTPAMLLPESTTLDPSICSGGLKNEAGCLAAVAWSSQPILAAGCKHLFLDVGSNIGVHTRFLYEPELYRPRHPYDDVMDGIFGRERLENDRRDLCSIGFEPNPLHRQRHQDLANAYAKMGWRYRAFFAGVSGWATPGDKLTFYRQDNGKNNDWGFSLKHSYGKKKNAEKHDVPIFSLATFVNEHVGGARPEKVLMKMDVEGSEYSTFPEMLDLRSFDNIDTMTYEFHARFCPIPVRLKDGVHEFSKQDCLDYAREFPRLLSAGFQTKLSEIDDEKHRKDGRPWPNPT